MAHMTLNAEIMAFGYSGMLASHKPEIDPSGGKTAADQTERQTRGGFMPVRSLLVQFLNPRA